MARRMADPDEAMFADTSFGSFSEPMQVQGGFDAPLPASKSVHLKKGSNGFGLQLETRYSEREDNYSTTISGIIPGEGGGGLEDQTGEAVAQSRCAFSVLRRARKKPERIRMYAATARSPTHWCRLGSVDILPFPLASVLPGTTASQSSDLHAGQQVRDVVSVGHGPGSLLHNRSLAGHLSFPS